MIHRAVTFSLLLVACSSSSSEAPPCQDTCGPASATPTGDPSPPPASGGLEGGITRADAGDGAVADPDAAVDAPPPFPQPALPPGLTSPFINVAWSTPSGGPGGHSRASVDIAPSISSPDDGPLQYFAFGGWSWTSGGNGFYGGLQTKILNNTVHSGKRGVIFSAWSVVDAVAFGDTAVVIDAVHCDGAAGAVCVQLSAAYPWKNGTSYRMTYAMAGSDRPGTQKVRASVTDLSTQVQKVLGDVIIPAAWGGFPDAYYTFDETFPPAGGETCQNYNPSDITYSNLRVGDALVPPTQWGQLSPAYDGPCVRLFHYDPIPDGYRMRLGIYAP